MSSGAALLSDYSAFENALGDRLKSDGRLDERGLERAMKAGATGREGLLAVLSKLGLVGDRDLASSVAAVLGLPLAGTADYPDAALASERLGSRFLREVRALPLREEGAALAVALADPLDGYALEAVRFATGRPVVPWVAVPAELDQAIERLYGRLDAASAAGGAAASDLSSTGDSDAHEPDVEQLRDLASEAPVIRLVNELVAQAAERRASDIHLEPFEDRMRVRTRIDGVLRDLEPVPWALRHAVVSRIKIMARLNIAERRLPQDGRLKMVIRGRPIDLRVATAPTLQGESVVLRLLDRESVALDFAALGIEGAACSASSRCSTGRTASSW